MVRKFVEYKTELQQNARSLRHNSTEPEMIIWRKILCRRQLFGYKFLRQKPLGKYIVDFYCPKLLLAIEIDGDTHDYENNYDKERTKELEKLGIVITRYTNLDVMRNIDGVYEDLCNKIRECEKVIETHPRPPLSGRENTRHSIP